MDKELRILILEDVPTDAELLEHELHNAGIVYSSKRVETREGFVKALQDFAPDIILSDYMLPHFDGMAALELTKEFAPTIPFIVVTGSMNEETAVGCMKAGAADYVIKTHLARIGPAVKGALKNKKIKEEKARLEEALWTSAMEWRATFDAVNNPVVLMDLEGRIRRCNKATANLLGKPFNEIIGHNCCGIVHGRLGPVEGCPFVRMSETHQREDLILLIRDRWFNIVVDPLFDENRHLIGAVHTIFDITERKQAEEALKESESRYKTLFDSTNDAIFVHDLEGRFLDVNHAACERLGYTREELLQMTPTDVDTKEFAALVPERIKQLIEHGHFLLETAHVRRNGTIIPTELSTRIIEYARNPAVLSIARDITERKRAEQEKAALEKQLRQSQKMEAIGRLAGGIAHDFNNLLTVISGNSQLSLLDLKEVDPLRENILEIQRAADRAAALTRQLLAFSRRQILEMRVLDLNSVLRDLDKMLRRVIGEDIELVFLLAKDLGRVETDPGQTEQVIMNLAINARDAMPNGGKLTIETANVELDENYAQTHLAMIPGRYVMLSVSDTGVGMTPEVRDRVFEPFFTTKEKGKGTGLGLSTVYGIVKQSGGNIWIYSEPGKGTTFKIYLPKVDEPLEELSEKVVGEELPRGSETILLVEDNEEVRKLAVRILGKQGYTVLEAFQGSEALLLCEDHKETIHLMVTDVVMPGMSGRELAERLALLHPEMKVLYMSGYTDNAITHHGVLEKGMNYIQKPFTVDGLARKVREVLDK